MEPLGIIAGGGELPLYVADDAVSKGYRVVVVAFSGFTDSGIGSRAHEVIWLKLGQVDKAISALKSFGVTRVVMAGKIEKSNLMRPWNLRLDMRALRIVRSLQDWRDDTILAGIAGELLKDGIVVDEITPWATKILAPLGPLTRRTPNSKQWKDIQFGRTMARGIGELDIGQTVVVKNAAVIVVEAIEGTDRAIRRAGDLGVSGAVVVKMAKPKQDMRFDVPGVGPSTIESMVAAKATVLAIEAGKTLMSSTEQMIRRAESSRISVVGIPPEGPLQ